MSLRTVSHGDLQNLSLSKLPAASDSSMFKSNSVSSNMGSRFGKESMEEIKGVSKPSHPPRRPVRAVRPVSALSGSFLQINHLQGELVRKRKECEDLKKENKYLSSEIHMERIVMRTESELSMRNLRNLNQELQAQVKELKQKLHLNQQRATMCSRAVEEADMSRSEAEKNRTLAEARALESKIERDAALGDKDQLTEELHSLSKEHKNLQLLLAQTEKNYFEAMLKLERVSGEKQFLLKDNKSLEDEKNTLRQKNKELTDENAKVKEKEASWRRKAAAAEEESQRAIKELQQAEHESRLSKRDKDKSVSECLSWREKHQALADIFRAQEDLISQRQNKACQANIKSYFLCMTESDQKIKILKNYDGTPRNFMEGDPVYISTASDEDSEKSSGRTLLRVAAPTAGRDSGPAHFSELSSTGVDISDSNARRRSRKVVDYFWIPTDQE
ncbi:golgin subfamily A member 6-like protein 22 [Silurus meridionalis]|uniref:Uncharacterized protein n=1 Tax=Silurus meridionalis TaxID=175797 RepID=A0A8T0B2E0_SILME|nr:golgin subfamily A member 6-like protein 22 [Silurus meridionalis]KAF7699006.1 hypothetical protein HF521_003748 [Silurus meridionalis]